MRYFVLPLLALASISSASTYVLDPMAVSAPQLKVGDLLVVKMNALPGAGYSWMAKGTQHPGLTLMSTKTLKGRPGMVGGAQQQVFTFKATKVGSQNLQLQYGRQWEIAKGATPQKTFSEVIVVK